MYTVKQVSEITGISSYTLRFYDKEGLFPHLNRDEQNRRLFSEADVSSIETIQDLRKMGFSLAQIRSYLGAEERSDAKVRRDIIMEQMNRLKSELAAVVRQMKMLQSKADLYEGVTDMQQLPAETPSWIAA
ncbi:MerR family transcriptional regulator [Cloacibacillus sp.]|uniref:MerR family transcriptional regulator n=1 Tax=Cloacibacillus sp. TaxID=2049023 RepID=UPI0025BA0678|nr:MerR family transcriptional regulator [Cloacibacillus sp.]MCC8057800.1 MerR family transcriptional regulator [Cloacibacillus sp.]